MRRRQFSTEPRPVPRAVTRPEVSRNLERDGVEIRFPEKPSEEIRATLKAAGFRWSRWSACWYIRRTPEAERLAEEIAAAASGVAA